MSRASSSAWAVPPARSRKSPTASSRRVSGARRDGDSVLAAARLTPDPHQPLHEHILAALGVAECPIEMLSSYFRTVDIYLRCRAKQEMVAALAHLPLVMCGEGWERVACCRGSHERPLQAMANGAVAAIGPSDY